MVITKNTIIPTRTHRGNVRPIIRAIRAVLRQFTSFLVYDIQKSIKVVKRAKTM